jgi:hypothetical protein
VKTKVIWRPIDRFRSFSSLAAVNDSLVNFLVVEIVHESRTSVIFHPLLSLSNRACYAEPGCPMRLLGLCCSSGPNLPLFPEENSYLCYFRF